jgi:hypothetical protein
MSHIGAKSYNLIEDSDGATHVNIKPASPESVETVLAADEDDEDDEDGRSEWLWVRLPNGDLILGVYPQGDTYLVTERDHSS